MSEEEELILAVNEFDEPLGAVSRLVAHKYGVWHRTINYIIVDKLQKKIILGTRITNKGLKASIIGGHLKKEESLHDNFRELFEETKLTKHNLRGFELAGKIKMEIADNADQFIGEFMYFYFIDIDLTALSNNFNNGEEHSSFIEFQLIDPSITASILLKNCDATDITSGKRISISSSFFNNFSNYPMWEEIVVAANNFCYNKPFFFKG